MEDAQMTELMGLPLISHSQQFVTRPGEGSGGGDSDSGSELRSPLPAESDAQGGGITTDSGSALRSPAYSNPPELPAESDAQGGSGGIPAKSSSDSGSKKLSHADSSPSESADSGVRDNNDAIAAEVTGGSASKADGDDADAATNVPERSPLPQGDQQARKRTRMSYICACCGSNESRSDWRSVVPNCNSKKKLCSNCETWSHMSKYKKQGLTAGIVQAVCDEIVAVGEKDFPDFVTNTKKFHAHSVMYREDNMVNDIGDFLKSVGDAFRNERSSYPNIPEHLDSDEAIRLLNFMLRCVWKSAPTADPSVVGNAQKDAMSGGGKQRHTQQARSSGGGKQRRTREEAGTSADGGGEVNIVSPDHLNYLKNREVRAKKICAVFFQALFAKLSELSDVEDEEKKKDFKELCIGTLFRQLNETLARARKKMNTSSTQDDLEESTLDLLTENNINNYILNRIDDIFSDRNKSSSTHGNKLGQLLYQCVGNELQCDVITMGDVQKACQQEACN